MSVGDGFEGAAEIGVWVDVVDFAGFDQRCHARPSAAALVMAGAEGVLAVQGDRADGIFDGVGVHLDAAIGQEDLQPVPVAVDVAELLATAGFRGDSGALLGQSQAEVSGQRGGFFLANGQTVLRRTTADAGFDLVDLSDAAQALGGDFGTILLIDVVQLAAGMRPAAGQHQGLAAHAPEFGQSLIPTALLTDLCP